jgi:hypothetical protein
MIRVHLWPLEETRTAAKGCAYMAACEIDGVPYSARSRHGAPNELARVLAAAGIPDQPMAVTHRGLKGEMTCRSFHEAARWTYRESVTEPLRRVRWVDPAVKHAQITGTIAAKQGVNAPGGTPVAPDGSRAVAAPAAI